MGAISSKDLFTDAEDDICWAGAQSFHEKEPVNTFKVCMMKTSKTSFVSVKSIV
jgi:hypothetical protein